MRLSSRLIERYIVKAITPYLLLGLLLLTMILLIQQSGRFAEFLLSTYVPLSLLTDVAGALLPNVLTFTVPMATLAGTIIGYSRMSSDSELIAIRAAGVSDLHILKPALLIGLCLTACTSLINLEMAPAAARSLRRAGIQAALYKLESPVEPRTFNLEIPGYVVYVREGDKEQGVWERVFIYSLEKNGSVRLITARSGRIDSASEQSELVLSDAVATTIPGTSLQEGNREGQYITERLAQLRIVLETGRKTLLESLQRDEPKLDEMGLDMLSAQARTQTGKEQREASTLLHRRISMSLTPLVFALLGGSLALRFGRGGRGWGGLLSLLTLIAYYMVSLLGEQMARKGTLRPSISVWLATAAALCLSLFLLLPKRGGLFLRSGKRTKIRKVAAPEDVHKQGLLQPVRSRLLNFPSILDLGVIRSLFLNSAFSYITLVAIFLIFTLFELWRFIGQDSGAVWRVVRYLLFLLPLATVQLLPASLLIAVLVTYALMARRSEAIAWWAGGQSSYRLIIPGLVFALFIGVLTWVIQERVMPQANLKQDALRAQIRGGGVSTSPGSAQQGRQWAPSATHAFGRLYSFKFDEVHGDLLDPAIYEFDAEGVHLSRIIEGRRGVWLPSGVLEIEEGAEILLQNSRIDYNRSPRLQLVGGGETPEMFKRQLNKPSHLSAGGLSEYIKIIKPTGRNINALQIALQKKYAEPHTAWVMTLFGIPLALSFGRRSAVTALCSSIAVGLAFWGISGILQQLGEYGILSPPVAVWSPLSVFAALGVYLLTRMRT